MDARLPTLAAVVAVVVALVSGCGGDDDGPPDPETPDASEAQADEDEVEADAGAVLPDTPAGEQLAWVLDEGRTADAAALQEHFDATFLAQVPVEQLGPTLEQVGALEVTEIGSSTDTELGVVATAADGTELLVSILVAAAPPHTIEGLLFQPADAPPAPATWEEVDARLDALSANTGLLVAEIDDDGDEVRSIHERSPDEAGPIGSAFKLYVLAAVADAVDRGELSWDDEVTVEEADRSMESGRLQDEVGSTVTVREAAMLMISISDNTATDLLIRLVGRAAVEAKLAAMGMGEASMARTLPFLTTQEMFELKWGVSEEERDAYVDASTDERRAMLDALPGGLPDAASIDPAVPVAIEELEWFASPRELVAAHAHLAGVPDVAPILGENPGVPVDPARWPSVAFKGGSEPGVVALTWFLERDDGRHFAVALLGWDTDRPVDPTDAASIGQGIIALLADA